jgi:hypothetical protein
VTPFKDGGAKRDSSVYKNGTFTEKTSDDDKNERRRKRRRRREGEELFRVFRTVSKRTRGFWCDDDEDEEEG